MTHPLVAARADKVRETAKYLRQQGATYEIEPEATAVVDVFLEKLRQPSSYAGKVPLTDLVTPEMLGAWRRQLDDEKERDDLLMALQFYGLMVPRVYPQPDGVVRIVLAWAHPDQAEPMVIDGPREVMSHMAYIENVQGLGWRLRNIE